MKDWLEHNRQQYRLMMTVLGNLMASGFSPVPTPPARDSHYRQDHTRSILELLSSFPEEVVPNPLKVFSTGPLYQPKTANWAETIDVEILGAPVPDQDQQAFSLIRRIMDDMGTESQLTMVLGHVGWLGDLVRAETGDPSLPQEIRTLLMQGNLAGAEDRLGSMAPVTQKLLTPNSPESFRHLASAVAAIQPAILTSLQSALGSRFQVQWDLSLTGSVPYYTGLVFELYLPGSGWPLLHGGRFAMDLIDRHWEGIGFTLHLDPLLSFQTQSGVEEGF